MDKKRLQELWETTTGSLEQQHLDPCITYRSPAWIRSRGESASDMNLPSPIEMTLDEDDLDKTVLELRISDEDEPYILKDRIARGGMGVIYRARQTVLQREIAMKKAHPQQEIQDRFLSEALVTANLDHPNIVPVYDLVKMEHGLALAMKLIGGMSWKDLLHPKTPEEQVRAKSYDFEAHIDILLKVCDAVAYAHSKGLTHNDLKPENVMVGEFGEVFVMDWGLTLDFREVQTHPIFAPPCSSINGEVFGTPSYMAPELAEGQGSSIGPWTDVYLLGAILYELIMGHPPHRGLTMMEVLLEASISQTPTYAPNTPKNLQEICNKAMARHPYQRYREVALFRDDVRAFLKHRESMLITEKAHKQLRQCQESMGHQFAAYDKTQSLTRVQNALRGDRNRLYIDISESVAGFTQARMLWANNQDARQGEHEARITFSRVALLHGDLGLAEAQAASLNAKHPEAISLFAEIETARHERSQAKSSARFQRHALLLGGIVFGLGLLLAVFLLNAERHRATRHASLAKKRLSELHRLADIKRLKDYQQETQHLWPAIPQKIKQMERWLTKSRELIAQRESHRKSLLQLRKSATQFKGKWLFKDRALQWQHDNLTVLVKQIKQFSKRLFKSVEARLKQARTLQMKSLVKYKKRWAHTIVQIADRSKNPQYKGLHIQPQIGLVPLGQDPRSKLWEFAHILSGTTPKRRANGSLHMTPQSGVVLVLLPAGTFQMGSVRASGKSRTSSRSGTKLSEEPVHSIKLSAFFLSKYELTQGQWMRFTDGHNPSEWAAGQKVGNRRYTRLHPVEHIRWQEASKILARMDLMLPTEAQWEYAARAGTKTAWSTGSRKKTLRGYVNLSDVTRQTNRGLERSEIERWLKDGYVNHAPIGHFLPNPWGLHDIYGNVWEWCFDRRGSYRIPVGTQNGLRMVSEAAARIIRGGSFRSLATHSRSASRQARNPSEYRSGDLGIRPALSLK